MRDSHYPLYITHYTNKGWTAIELIMVVTIVAILAVLSIPRFESFYFVKLQSAVKRVVSDIRYTQQLSIARHENYKIVFNTAAETCEVRRVSDNSYATDPFTRGNMAVDFDTDPQYEGIDIYSTNLTSGTLQFDWQGIPLDVSGTALSAEATVELRYKGYARTIYVTPNTGRVRVQ